MCHVDRAWLTRRLGFVKRVTYFQAYDLAIFTDKCLGGQHNQYEPSHSFERNAMEISRKKKIIKMKKKMETTTLLTLTKQPNSVPSVDSIKFQMSLNIKRIKMTQLLTACGFHIHPTMAVKGKLYEEQKNPNSMRCDHWNGSDNGSTNECAAYVVCIGIIEVDEKVDFQWQW